MLDCEPVFDYGRRRASWAHTGDDYYQGAATAEGIDLDLRLTSDMRIGFEGPRATARTLIKEGETRFCALSWSEHEPPHDLRRGLRAAGVDRASLAALAGPRQLPDHPWRSHLQRSALTLKGLTYAPTGALVAGAHDLAARDARRRAQLGLPLHLDPRLDVHALGPVHARLRLGGQRLLLLHRRRGRERRGPADHVRHRRRDELDEQVLDHLHGYDGARPVRIGNGAYNQRQHDVWGAVLDSVYLHTKSRDRLDERVWPILKRQVECGARALARARSRDLGGPRRAQALHLVEGDVLGRGRPRRAPGRDPRGRRRGGALAGRRRRDPRRHLRARRRRARRLHPALRHRGARRLGAADAAGPLPARRRRARARDGAGDRRRADRGRPGAALQGRGDRRRPLPARRARSRSARSGWCPRWSRSARLDRARELCEKLLSYASPLGLFGRRSTPHGPPSGQLPAGLHAPRADQRGHARDRRRAALAGGGPVPGTIVPEPGR